MRPETRKRRRASRAPPLDFFLVESAAQFSCRESKTPSFSILGRQRNNQRPVAQMHPKGYPNGVTGGCPQQFPGSPPSEWVILGSVALPAPQRISPRRVCPRYRNPVWRCTCFSISEFASLVRKSYSRARAPSVPSYWNSHVLFSKNRNSGVFGSGFQDKHQQGAASGWPQCFRIYQ